jgi:predicted small secreted protein
MKHYRAFLLFLIVALLLVACNAGVGSDAQSNSGSTSAIIVDHTDTDASIVPDSAITAAAALDVYFEHASVGGNVMDGVAAFASAPSSRYGYLSSAYASGTQPSDQERSDIASWFDSHDGGVVDFMRGNPSLTNKIDWFVATMDTNVGTTPTKFATHVDVAMFKFCWIDDAYLSTAPTTEFNAVRTAMEGLESRYPDTIFVWWTMPICQAGAYSDEVNAKRDVYNTFVRNYCTSNDKPLFDLADIESHSADGTALVDSAGHERLDPSYASDDGHLNAVGGARMANAWWVLLAKLSGWDN